MTSRIDPMRMMGFVSAMLVGLGLWGAPARAAVNIQVDLSTQTMHVQSSRGGSYDWPVSTAREGFTTPRGRYGVQSLQAMHYSRKYHNSPMPHSIFFHGGYAIHGTSATASLGAAASHGCVRLSPAHAAELYKMVRAEGASISIVGSRPSRADTQVALRRIFDERQVALRRTFDERQVAAAEPADEPVVTRHHRAGRSHGTVAGGGYGEAPLAYAPLRRSAPSYGDWMQNPFGALMNDGD